MLRKREAAAMCHFSYRLSIFAGTRHNKACEWGSAPSGLVIVVLGDARPPLELGILGIAPPNYDKRYNIVAELPPLEQLQ